MKCVTLWAPFRFAKLVAQNFWIFPTPKFISIYHPSFVIGKSRWSFDTPSFLTKWREYIWRENSEYKKLVEILKTNSFSPQHSGVFFTKWTAKELGFNVVETYVENGGLFKTKLQRNMQISHGHATWTRIHTITNVPYLKKKSTFRVGKRLW